MARFASSLASAAGKLRVGDSLRVDKHVLNEVRGGAQPEKRSSRCFLDSVNAQRNILSRERACSPVVNVRRELSARTRVILRQPKY